MARESLFKNPLFAWLLRAVGSFPVVRNTADISALKSALARLSSGAGLLLFPEGTRGGGAIQKKPHPGVAFLAVKAKVPIIPVFVSGTDKALPRGSRFFKPAAVRVTFGKPIFPDPGIEYEVIVRDVIDKIGQLAW